ncbi:exodeoxyribonuclease V subunit alpha [Psychrobium sp. MM17-31]|uniref:exodeoxyribonuclease V subunit alpha n=1 Tax=Psychrobium sp. MM17-31 TaxID=2917758 RepID=UPI001EF6F69C|nr:exodeoxyribonuclease V subunit alpha [Psychrobium sp. MM17-31]MCG7532101.1 exodeoxyribonuclease V subunit alpha [Psychrobium sp. MM17-31]
MSLEKTEIIDNSDKMQALLTQLEQLSRDKHIRVLDYQFARFIARFEPSPLVVLAAAVASYQSGQGHVCVYLDNNQLDTLFNLPPFVRSSLLTPLFNAVNSSASQWQQDMTQALNNSKNVGENAPLMLVANRLYLQRYWHSEQAISQFLHQRSTTIAHSDIAARLNDLFRVDIAFCWQQLQALKAQGLKLDSFCSDYFHLREDIGVDSEAMAQYLSNIDSIAELEELYQQFSPAQRIDWQQVAVAQASASKFSVISGGPGTGKTTTVIKLLALLVGQALDNNQSLNIELVAPTGKAAARLTESISGAIKRLNVDEQLKQLIPTQASTIHRLLGVIPNRQAFKHNKSNKLHVDVLIVDEASMIDISLMSKLFDAIAPHTKLVLLGDKDQLSSVEAGAVFADICHGISNGPNYSQQTKTWLTEQMGFVIDELCHNNQQGSVIDDSLCLLQKSYRFNEKSGIGVLASAVNRSDISALQAVWQQGFDDIALHTQDKPQQAVIRLASLGYQDYLTNANALSNAVGVEALLAQFGEFQLLAPTKNGALGVDTLNEKIEQQLIKHQLIAPKQGVWYIGRPVMITSNDHSLQLYNGDIGIVLPDFDGDERSPNRVYFKMADGSIKSFLPSRLPDCDTVYAMTIHKSQGSEFEHVVMAMPETFSPLLTKELLYTGITRAKKSVEIFSDAGILQKMALAHTKRFSGLVNLLSS